MEMETIDLGSDHEEDFIRIDVGESPEKRGDAGLEVVVTKPRFNLLTRTPERNDKDEVKAEPRSFFPGDLTVLKVKKSMDLSPKYGTVIGIYHPDHIDPDNCDPNIFCESSNTEFYVHWENSHKISKVKASEVGLVDRVMELGSRVTNDKEEDGSVVHQKFLATVQIVGTNHVIDCVPLNELRPISSFARGLEFIYGDWIGIIEGVQKSTEYRTEGGAKFSTGCYEADPYRKADPYWGPGSYCPGMRISCNRRLLKKAQWSSAPMRFLWKWLPGVSYLYAMSQVTITRTETIGIKVKWLEQVHWVTQEGKPPEFTYLSGDQLQNVQVIGRPSVETIGINSVRIYKLKPKDALLNYMTWYNGFQGRFMREDGSNYSSLTPLSKTPLDNFSSPNGEFDVPVKVILRQSEVDIEWRKDGSIETVRAASLPSISHDLQDPELPSGLVVSPLFIKSQADKLKFGVIQSHEEFVTSNAKMVRVKWFQIKNVESAEELGLSDESIYDITHHSSLSLFQKGTIVLAKNPRLLKFNAGVVSELDVRNGRMILMFADGISRSVYPHSVTPMKKRCSWNFFQNKWIVDDLLPPPHHISAAYEEERAPVPVVNQANNNFNWVSNSEEDSIWNKSPFDLMEHAPETHSFLKKYPVNYEKNYTDLLLHEQKVIYKNIPPGMWIRTYENRMDLFSALMIGHKGTPYEDSLFLFDLYIPYGFPVIRPRIKYISFAEDLSPAMASDGNFCTHMLDLDFNPRPKSYVLEILSQIRDLVFKKEPYFTHDEEAMNAQGGSYQESSRAYNEMVFLRCLEGGYNMVKRPHEPWGRHIHSHYSTILPEKFKAVESWLKFEEESGEAPQLPDYPLLPVSPGFRTALLTRLAKIHAILPPGALDLTSISTAVIQEAPLKERESEVAILAQVRAQSLTTVVSLEGALISSDSLELAEPPEMISAE